MPLHVLLLLLAPQAGGQRPSQEEALLGPGQAGEPRPALLDGVALQAGDAVLTFSELQRALDLAARRVQPRDADEQTQMMAGVLRDQAILRLEQEAGQDLGFDKAQIERITRLNLQDERERIGLDAYQEQLEAQGQDALQDEAEKARDIYREIWELTQTGAGVAGRRPTLDRSIRPGQLRAFYEEARPLLAPTLVQLQLLVVSSQAAGSPELARQSCLDARDRVLDGEDLGTLVDELGVEFRSTRGLTQLVPLQAIRDPAIRAFAETAAIGELSEVAPILNGQGQPDPALGYQLVQMHERQEQPQPDFETLEVQSSLRGYFLKRRRDVLLDRERAQLARHAYVWIHPRLPGGQPPSPGAEGSPDPAPAPR